VELLHQDSRQKSCLRADGTSLERFPRGTLGTPTRYWIDRELPRLVATHCSKHARILDLGCHDGAYSSVFEEQGIEGSYLGVDIAAANEWSDRTQEQGRLRTEFREFDAHRIAELEPRGFDFILSITTFEHFEHDDVVLDGVVEQLLPGGKFLLIVPSEHSFWLYGRHGFRRYRIKETTDAFEARGLRVVAVEGGCGLASFAFHAGLFASSNLLTFSGKATLGLLAGGSRRRAKQIFPTLDNALNSTLFWHQKFELGRTLHSKINSQAAALDSALRGLPALYMFVGQKH
jgi:SAM-dependent methyltransferase